MSRRSLGNVRANGSRSRVLRRLPDQRVDEAVRASANVRFAGSVPGRLDAAGAGARAVPSARNACSGWADGRCAATAARAGCVSSGPRCPAAASWDDAWRTSGRSAARCSADGCSADGSTSHAAEATGGLSAARRSDGPWHGHGAGDSRCASSSRHDAGHASWCSTAASAWRADERGRAAAPSWRLHAAAAAPRHAWRPAASAGRSDEHGRPAASAGRSDEHGRPAASAGRSDEHGCPTAASWRLHATAAATGHAPTWYGARAVRCPAASRHAPTRYGARAVRCPAASAPGTAALRRCAGGTACAGRSRGCGQRT